MPLISRGMTFLAVFRGAACHARAAKAVKTG